ncbi:MAG: SBBP repeat-containing protein [bacterium]
MILMRLFAIVFCITFFLLTGCSNGKSPVIPGAITELDNSSPLAEISSSGGPYSGIGLLGAYELTINSNDKSIELIPKRSSTIGESFTVNGLVFFTKTPCFDCFNIKSLKWLNDGIILKFEIKHPLPMGDTGQPPSAGNRQDLDVFDVAAVIKPGGTYLPMNFSLSSKKAYADIVSNADGYTNDLANLITDPNALFPYVLVVDNSETGTNTWNKFEMGATAEFDIEFNKRTDFLVFDIYLTFGYGVSANWKSRFEPKYYNPEFNRKSAWKVEASPKSFWVKNSPDPVDVEVKVYDWQIGATVSPEPNFADADPGHVYAASEIESVSVEIPAINNTILSVDGDSYISGDGSPTDPYIYNIPVVFNASLSAFRYPALVKVTDQRPVLLPDDNRDILIDSLDGIQLDKYQLPEYATYQTFDAKVAGNFPGYCWTKIWGSLGDDRARSIALDTVGNIYVAGEKSVPYSHSDPFLYKFDLNGNLIWSKSWVGTSGDYGYRVVIHDDVDVYVCGEFSEVMNFNPDGGGGILSNGDSDAFLTKFDADGNWLWAKTWGDTGRDRARSIDLLSSGEIFAVGTYENTVDFNPQGGDPHTSNGQSDIFVSKFDSNGNWQKTQTWGGANYDEVSAISSDSNNDVYITGKYELAVDFNPDGGDTHTSNGFGDVFLSKFNSNVNWQWTKTWGGPFSDYSYSVLAEDTGNIFTTGTFSGTANFNPDGGGAQTAIGGVDVFLSKFASDGSWQWSKKWGGSDFDFGFGISVNPAGNIFVIGKYKGLAQFNPIGGGFETSNNNSDDAFMNILDSNGGWVAAKVWGGVDDDFANGIYIDPYGNQYVTGSFMYSVDFNPDGGGQQSSAGEIDCYLSKFNY